MKTLWLIAACIILALIAVPALIVSVWGWLAPPPPPVESPYLVNVLLTSTGQVVTMTLEDYVQGVVAAEMPALFAEAALEAQAVAARTYAVRRMRQFGGNGCNRHPQADVCDDPAHCQAYLPLAAQKQKWGLLDFAANYYKIRRAVESTAGLVITYRGRVIDPIFHSTCGGRTEYAHLVWTNEYPYLASVACNFCQHSRRLTAERQLTVAEVAELLAAWDPAVAVTARALRSRTPPLAVVERSQSGRVLRVRVGNRTIAGTQFRAIFGLDSTNFALAIQGERVTITTRGFGHGVGMCQWGADGLAREGRNFREILAHYYGAVQVIELTR